MNTTDNPISNHASYVPAQVACSWQESQIYMLQSAFFYWGKTGFQESETRGWCLHTQLPNRILKTPDKITGYSRLDFTHVHFSLKVLKYAVLQFYFINFFQYLEIKALFPLLLLSILVFCLVAHFHKLHMSRRMWLELNNAEWIKPGAGGCSCGESRGQPHRCFPAWLHQSICVCMSYESASVCDDVHSCYYHS